jgi:hypothetical protein
MSDLAKFYTREELVNEVRLEVDSDFSTADSTLKRDMRAAAVWFSRKLLVDHGSRCYMGTMEFCLELGRRVGRSDETHWFGLATPRDVAEAATECWNDFALQKRKELGDG